jgi:hypothetical protein
MKIGLMVGFMSESIQAKTDTVSGSQYDELVEADQDFLGSRSDSKVAD